MLVPDAGSVVSAAGSFHLRLDRVVVQVVVVLGTQLHSEALQNQTDTHQPRGQKHLLLLTTFRTLFHCTYSLRVRAVQVKFHKSWLLSNKAALLPLLHLGSTRASCRRRRSRSCTHLNDLFDDGLVGAHLGPLERAHGRPDPHDEGELGAAAQLVSRRDAHEAEAPLVVCQHFVVTLKQFVICGLLEVLAWCFLWI